MDQLTQLKSENASLQAELATLKEQMGLMEAMLREESGQGMRMSSMMEQTSTGTENKSVGIVVLGASGDLAKKKTYPALFHLYRFGLIPKETIVVGYGRSPMTRDDFLKKTVAFAIKGFDDELSEFSKRCYYFHGGYDSAEDIKKLNQEMEAIEKTTVPDWQGANRVFYMALPPSVFYMAAATLKPHCLSKTGWNRVIVEKPFGKDLESSNKLSKELSSLFSEDQIYRIDHYLGKEMVQNLMVMRFANSTFEPIWNSHHISSVKITFKEDFGTEGRAGYFDSFGIIRDVMQNHLLQIFALVAMETPVTLQAEDVRDEKVKVLRATSSIAIDDVVVGQYVANPDKNKPGYKDDKDIPQDSVTPTFAQAVLHINNERWHGVPFILKCGKALEERKAEIRIQFKKTGMHLFPNSNPNELVMRVQPDEAVYLKMTNKVPGLSSDIVQSELDMSYKQRFDQVGHNPDAYERLIMDVFRGDHNLFVRDDELSAAWKIFTPMLHYLEKEKIQPRPYVYGSRGPTEADDLSLKYGYKKYDGYTWKSRM